MKHWNVLVVACVLALTGSVLAGDGDPVYALSADGPAGDTIQGTPGVTVGVSLDSSGGDQVQGWSWGACHDMSVLTVVDVVDGSTTATVADGDPPDFDTITLLPDGWTVGVVISFLGCCLLPPGAGYEMNLATYDVADLGLSPEDPAVLTDICFCSTLGDPPVATVVVSSGSSIPPTTSCGTLSIIGIPPPPAFIYRAPQSNPPDLMVGPGEFGYDPAVGDATATTNASIEDALAPTDDNTQGFSMGLSNDSSIATATDLVPAGDVAALDGGMGPDFFGITLLPSGWTVGVVYRFLGGVFIQFDVPKDVVTATYETAGSLLGDMDGAQMSLTWDTTLGDPPVANVVVVSGQSFPAGFADGSVTFEPILETDFIRGDCNDDGIVNIADAVYLLNFLFLEGPSPNCPAACDANDDGDVSGVEDSADAIYILNYRFLDGPPPPAPFPDCGPDGGTDCMSSCP